jgi:hypothetical protein
MSGLPDPDGRRKIGRVYGKRARLPPRWVFQKGVKLGEIIEFDDLKQRQRRRQAWREEQLARARGGDGDAA